MENVDPEFPHREQFNSVPASSVNQSKVTIFFKHGLGFALVILISLLSTVAFAITRQSAPGTDTPSSTPQAEVRATVRITPTTEPSPTVTPTRTPRRSIVPEVAPTPWPTSPPPISVQIDLDIDADNSGSIDESDDPIEEDWPGKIIVAHDMDTDYDGVPDFVDGITNAQTLANITTYNGEPVGSAGTTLTPMTLRVRTSRALPRETTIRFSCSPTPDRIPPNSITFTPDNEYEGGSFHYNFPYGPSYRIWTKDGNVPRSGIPFEEGGDLILCNESIPISQLSRISTLYLEPLVQAKIEISVYLDIPFHDDNDNPITLTEDSETSDAIVARAIKVEVGDVRGWDPSWNGSDSPDSYGQGQLSFRYPPDRQNARHYNSAPIGGAIADGASLSFVTLQLPFDQDQELENRLSIRVDPVSGAAESDDADVPQTFGGFKPMFNDQGQMALPPLPMPRFAVTGAGLHRKQQFVDGALFYLTPRNFVASASVLGQNYSIGNRIASATDEVAQMGFSIIYRSGGPRTERVVGQVPFRLRRPPLVVVHGLNGQGGGGYWSIAVWDESNTDLSTRLYYADYHTQAEKGYSENMLYVPDTIDRALEEYRFARDNIVAGGSSTGDRHLLSRSFRRIRYAASRVDVVGHSMGGQITRTFISNISGIYGRQNTWGNMYFQRSGRGAYFRQQNLGAGAIRRFIPIGSPFLGSPYATSMEPAVRPNSTLNELLLRAAREQPNTIGELLIQMGVVRNVGGILLTTTPTAVADLAQGSVVQRLLENAAYPIGDKAVMWYPIAGYAELNANSSELPEGAGQYWDLLQCGSLIGSASVFSPLIDWMASAAYNDALSAPISDYVVPTNSQRNAQIRGDTDDANILRNGTANLDNWNIGVTVPRTVHSWSILNFQPVCASNGQSLFNEFGHLRLTYENGSPVVGSKVGEALLATDDLPEVGPTALNPGGNGGLQSTGLGLPY